jgi:CRISPR-associated protein Cas1
VRSLPIENIRAVIIAAKGVSISSALLGALLDVDCLILHLSPKYQPVGWTVPIPRTMHQDILTHQINPKSRVKERLWQEILRAKITNQREILTYLGLSPNPMESCLAGRLDEGGAARIYFGHFFKALDAVKQNRSQRHRGWLNGLLNYGYAVLTSMIHRSIIVHGLMANIGVHHKARYRSYPLVYDLMEPLRPLVDGLVINFLAGWAELAKDNPPEGDAVKLFSKFIGNGLRDFRQSHERYSLKLIDAIDIYVRGVAKVFLTQSMEGLWIPHVNLDRLADYQFKVDDGRSPAS